MTVVSVRVRKFGHLRGRVVVVSFGGGNATHTYYPTLRAAREEAARVRRCDKRSPCAESYPEDLVDLSAGPLGKTPSAP